MVFEEPPRTAEVAAILDYDKVQAGYAGARATTYLESAFGEAGLVKAEPAFQLGRI